MLELPPEQQRSECTEHTAEERLPEKERLAEEEGMPEEERMAEEDCVPKEEGVPQDSMPEQQHPTKLKPQC